MGCTAESVPVDPLSGELDAALVCVDATAFRSGINGYRSLSLY